jgi:hypothetical protein
MIAPVARRALFGLAFVLLATANSAGYRYAASDQAFYIPAVLRHLDPALFPADAPLIDSQARLTVVDETIAVLARVTRVSLPYLFLALYLLTLALLLTGAVRAGRHFFSNRWSAVALAAALTLRHAIAKTGANTLEGYFHPRELAFALGVWALAVWIERRGAGCAVLLAGAAAIHPTTGAWFILLLGFATLVRRRLPWRTVAAVAILGIAVAAVATRVGPLAGRFVRMDPAWLAVIADKDYLFPLDWPANVWATNLVTIVIVLVCWMARRAQARTFDGEHALVAGAVALVVLFFAWLPFDAAHIALAVQLQVSRLFWVLDFLATIYLVWMIAEFRTARPRARVIALALVIAAAARGGYSMLVQFHDRPLFAVHIAHGDWRDAMTWAQSTPASSNWLADPLHAVRYGSSVRAAGRRDVLLEQVKDTAIAMYDRSIAMRVSGRERAMAAHPWDTVEGAQALARAYSLDYLVIDRELPLVEAHRSGSLHIYRLR